MRGVKQVFLALGLSVGLLALPSSAATPPAFGVQPFEFVGAAGDCGPGYPAGTDTVTAQWDNTTGNPAPSIFLEKTGDIANCAAAGVDITTPLEGGPVSNLTELNFDVKTGEYCGAGAPRFNIQTDQGTGFLGCTSGTHTDLLNGWTHVVFSQADIDAALVTAGVNPATATLQDLYMIFDEIGSTHIDNISVNGEVVGSPTSPLTKDECKKGGYANFNPAFANQGDCVSYVATNGKNTPGLHKH